MEASSREALIFEVWFRIHLRPSILRIALERVARDKRSAHSAAERALAAPPYVHFPEDDIAALASPEDHLGLDKQGLAALVAETLTSARSTLNRWLGPEAPDNRWCWGSLSHAASIHPLRNLLLEKLEESALSVGPVPRGGSFDSVGVNGYDESFRHVLGSTVRVVLDVGDWDQSQAINAPGQSGDPRSPFYTNLIPRWAAGEGFPLRYTRSAIENATISRIILLPATPKTTPTDRDVMSTDSVGNR